MNQANKQDLKTALVTGGARRIGASIATELHHRGFNLIIHCHRSIEEAAALAAELNAKRYNSAWVIAKDLCEKNAATALIDACLKQFGRLDVLVNNASVFHPSPIDKPFDEGLWDELFDCNVKAPYKLSLAAFDALSQTKGVIINLTDIHAERALKKYAIYCQSKAALVMQSKALAREFAPRVRVNAVAPGAIAWPEEDNALTVKQQQEIIAQTPLKKHGHPDFIAKAVLALIENEFITGQVLNVDGGRSLAGP